MNQITPNDKCLMAALQSLDKLEIQPDDHGYSLCLLV